MTPDVLAALWEMDGDVTVSPLGAGSNNLSFAVQDDAQRYSLRVYRHTGDEARVQYELGLLDYLAGCRLSFAVPTPVRTRAGELAAHVADGQTAALAVLFHWIEGEHVTEGPQVLRTCGAALAELDEAFAGVQLAPPASAFPQYRDLRRLHPLVADPVGMVGDLPLEGEEREALTALVERVVNGTESLYARLPITVVHRDFDLSNVLVSAGQVTGVLDFEFAHPDARALDLAVGVQQFGPSPSDDRVAWPSIEAFAAGYLERMPLKAREIHAIPALIRVQRVVSIISRAGRLRAGTGELDSVLSRARWALLTDRWLQAEEERLVSMLLWRRG